VLVVRKLPRTRVQSLSNLCLNENSGGREFSSTRGEVAPCPLNRSGVVLFRAFPAIPDKLAPLVDSALTAGHPWTGHLSIVTQNGIEMIRAGQPSP